MATARAGQYYDNHHVSQHVITTITVYYILYRQVSAYLYRGVDLYLDDESFNLWNTFNFTLAFYLTFCYNIDLCTNCVIAISCNHEKEYHIVIFFDIAQL